MQDKVHVPPRLRPACLEEVEGFTSASPRQSLVKREHCGSIRLTAYSIAQHGLCLIITVI
jgi:hypothetical protein